MYGLLLAALTVLAAPQAEADDTELPLQVRRLVRQLDAVRLAERDAAEAALIEVGPVVLDLLPPVTDQTPADVAQRLGRVRQKLEQAAAKVMAQPSAITLPESTMRLSEVLAALGAQSGNAIVDARARFGHQVVDPELKVDFDETPFWQALDTVLDMAGLTVYPYGEDRATYLVARPDGQAPRRSRAHYTGPLRMEPVRVQSERNLRRAGSALLQVHSEITWEPRVRPISLEQPMSAVVATDEHGHRLAVDDPEAVLEVPIDTEIATDLSYSFQAPARDAERIDSLSGSLRAVIPGKVATFRFDRLGEAKTVRQRIGGATVTLEEVRRTGELWEVAVRVQFDDAGPALESHRGWIFRNPAYLEKPVGGAVAYERFETTRQTENEVGLAFLFALDEPLGDFRFVYETPASVLVVDLPYVLKDIPLP